jgi:hypothetical protein
VQLSWSELDVDRSHTLDRSEFEKVMGSLTKEEWREVRARTGFMIRTEDEINGNVGKYQSIQIMISLMYA